MRRWPVLELVMAAVVVVSVVLILRATGGAEDIVRNEWACFHVLNALGRDAPLPEDLERIDGAYRRSGYLFAAWRPGEDGPVAADVAEVLAGEGPYLVVAWPEVRDETGRRAFAFRWPGFVLQTENDVRPLSGLPVPACPWPRITAPPGAPMRPTRGAPRGWEFLHRRKQRARLHALGLRYTDRTGGDDD